MKLCLNHHRVEIKVVVLYSIALFNLYCIAFGNLVHSTICFGEKLILVGGLNCDVSGLIGSLHPTTDFSLFTIPNWSVNRRTHQSDKYSATSIDLVLANVKENIHASGVIHLGISDHCLIYAVRKFMLPKANPSVREIRDCKHFDAELFLEDLSRMPWNAIQQFNNPNTCWNVWKSLLLRH